MDPMLDKKHTTTDSTNATNDTASHVLRYDEVDGETREPTGRSVLFDGVQLQPLQYSDLIDQKLGHKVVIPLSWKNSRVLESTIPEITIDKFASVKTTLESIYSSKTIGLVRGGWLPSGLALQSDMIVMPDRCTFSELVGRFRNGEKKSESDKDFLDLFADQRIRVNPLLYALEGNLKENPTPEIVKQQLLEGYAKIKSALPLADLVPEQEGGLQSVIGIIQNTQVSMSRKQDFLMRLAPKLSAPVSTLRLPALWEEVLAIAEDCKIPRRSLVVFAALSSIAVPNGRSPAKRLLKLGTPSYKEQDAYNALADLRSLEVLMNLFALFPSERLLLCTGDKDLALFWAGIRASDFSWANGHACLNLSPVEALWPNATPEQVSSYLDERKVDINIDI